LAITLLAFAYIAILYIMILLVTLNIGLPRFGKYQKRRKVMQKSTQGKEIKFALKEGATIVAVEDTTKSMCFYIGNDTMDSKNYE